MKTSIKTLSAAVAALSIAGASAGVLANQNHKDRGDDDSAALVHTVALSAEKAMAIVLADVPGKIIEVELEPEDGTVVWEIEVVDAQNQVYEFEIDANSGEILEKEFDDH